MGSEYASIKSTPGTIKLFTDNLKEFVLAENEKLSKSPASMLGLLTNTIGEITSNTFFEQLMYRREMFLSSALKYKTLMRQLNSQQIAKVYGSPSEYTFVLGFIKDEIIKNAVYTQYGDRRLRINKNATFGISGDIADFTLDHDVDIIINEYETNNITRNSIYAKFDVSDKYDDVMSNVSNPFIFTRSDVKINGVDYFIMYLPVRQYTRTDYLYEINGDNYNSFDIAFDEHLMGFHVFHRELGSEVYKLLPCEPEGNMNLFGPNFFIENTGDYKKVVVKFSKVPGHYFPSNGTIKIVLNTTTGAKGNFTIKEKDSLSEIRFTLNQDRDDETQNALLTFKPLVSIKDFESSGGKNEMSVEDIRNYVMNLKTNNRILTLGEFERKAIDLECTIKKVKDDIQSIQYRMFSVLKKDNIVVPTSLSSLVFSDVDIPVIGAIDARIITPKMIFRQNTFSKKYEYIISPESFESYSTKYNSDTQFDMCFPFYIKNTTNKELKTEVFDISKNETIPLNFLYYNEISSDKTSILNYILHKNPFGADEYRIEYEVNVTSQVIDYINSYDPLLDPAFIKSRVSIRNILLNEMYVAESEIVAINSQTNILTFRAVLKTDNSISNDNRLCITEHSIQPSPYKIENEITSFYYIEETLDVRVYTVLLNNEINTSVPSSDYDYILSDTEKANDYYVSSVYETKNVNFFTDLTSNFFVSPEIKVLQPVYATYPSDVKDTYSETIYEKDINGDIVFEEKTYTHPDNTTSVIGNVPKVLFYKDEIKKDGNDDDIILHHAGDVVTDKFGIPAIASCDSYEFYLHGVPTYNRIFATYNEFDTIRNMYLDKLDVINSFVSSIPESWTLSLGVKNTQGVGYYKFVNKATNEEEYLNNVSLSLKLGIKLNNDYGINVEYVKETVIDTITEYIITYKEKEFSFNKMLNHIKTIVPGIDYFELYNVNGYDNGVCQSIYIDTTGTYNNEYILNIKNVVDESQSNFTSGFIVYKHAIEITIL